MSHLTNQGSTQANSWANSRREAIEKAQKLRDGIKYNFTKTGEMTMGNNNPKDKNATMTAQGSTAKNSRLGQTGTPSTGHDDTRGYKKSMTATYDYSSAHQGSVPHEEHQQASSSLRLLKAKMSGGRSNTQNMDQLDAFANEPTNTRYEREQEIKKDANRQDNVKRQPLEEGSHQNNQNYRKIFKPNFDNDTKTKELPSQSTGYNKPQPSRTQAPKQGSYLDERQLKTIPMVHEDEDTGFSSHNIPSRIPKSTAGQKAHNEDNYIASKASNQMAGGKLGGAKRVREDQPIYGEEFPVNEYRPASKQQYPAKQQERQQEKVYDPSQYLANAPGKGPARDSMNSSKPKPTVQKAAPKQYQRAYEEEDIDYERKPRRNPFEEGDEEAGRAEELEQCPEGCGRKFFPNVLEKHANVCRKVFQSKRKAFNMAAQRQTEDQAKLGENKPASKFNPNRTGLQPTKTAASRPLPKSAKWKQQSEVFRANLKAARGEQLTSEEQVTVKKKNDDYVQCDYCSRNFNEEAAKRHIPFCQNKQKMVSMKRGPPKGKSKK